VGLIVYNNNKAFKSQASWGRLDMKSIKPKIKGQTKIKADGKGKREKKKREKSIKTKRKG
jgi:hypothetical protein